MTFNEMKKEFKIIQFSAHHYKIGSYINLYPSTETIYHNIENDRWAFESLDKNAIVKLLEQHDQPEYVRWSRANGKFVQK